jgi:nucleoside-diphosphate-sugar epimerase
MTSLQGKRVLVTGATGLIGGRLIERLILEQGAEVVALVHQFRNASRLARFPLRLVAGDVTEVAVVKKAAEGCDAIVHCAVTFAGTAEANRMVTVEGARNVCEAAKSVGVRRVVHFSTFSVYGDTAPGPLTEEAARRPGKDAYGGSKLEAEQLVQQYQQRGLPATILQPTIVYGPWSFWSSHTARQLLAGEMALPENGAGLCNAVYVDDVVEAVLLSLRRESPALGPFLISAAKPVTWRSYYLAHAVALPGAAVAGMTTKELAALMQNRYASRSIKQILPANLRIHLRGLVAEMPGARKIYRQVKGRRLRRENVALLASGEEDVDTVKSVRRRALPLAEHLPLLCSQTAVHIQRARTELGYEPKFDLARGGAITAKWLQWAGYGKTSCTV